MMTRFGSFLSVAFRSAKVARRITIATFAERKATLLLAVFVSTCAVDGFAQTNRYDDAEQKLVRGLVERNLVDLADAHLDTLSQNPELSGADRVNLIVDRLQVQTRRALAANGENRDAAWQQLDAIATPPTDRTIDRSRWLLVPMQHAMSELARANQIQQELAASMAGAGAAARFDSTIESALSRLKQLERDVTATMDDRRGKTVAVWLAFR